MHDQRRHNREYADGFSAGAACERAAHVAVSQPPPPDCYPPTIWTKASVQALRVGITSARADYDTPWYIEVTGGSPTRAYRILRCGSPTLLGSVLDDTDYFDPTRFSYVLNTMKMRPYVGPSKRVEAPTARREWLGLMVSSLPTPVALRGRLGRVWRVERVRGGSMPNVVSISSPENDAIGRVVGLADYTPGLAADVLNALEVPVPPDVA